MLKNMNEKLPITGLEGQLFVKRYFSSMKFMAYQMSKRSETRFFRILC